LKIQTYIKSLLLLGLILLGSLGLAQNNKVKPNYVYCYKETTLETDDYKIYIVSGQNEYDYAKFKIRIFNKTTDYLIFKPSECSFLIGTQDLIPKDKQIVVPPNSEESKVIDVNGKNCQVEKFTFEIKTYYKVMNDLPPIQVEAFNLPPKKNDFKAGAFECKHLSNKLNTEKSNIKFGCTYVGEGIGILDPDKCSAVMPGGKENVNSKQHQSMLLEKGKYEDFAVEIRTIPNTGDMSSEPFKIKWNDTFKDSKVMPLKGSKVEIELDKEKTEKKNN
jgi:hypothetical protein